MDPVDVYIKTIVEAENLANRIVDQAGLEGRHLTLGEHEQIRRVLRLRDFAAKGLSDQVVKVIQCLADGSKPQPVPTPAPMKVTSARRPIYRRKQRKKIDANLRVAVVPTYSTLDGREGVRELLEYTPFSEMEDVPGLGWPMQHRGRYAATHSR